MPSAAYPNVPVTQGVPPVLRGPTAALKAIGDLDGASTSLLNLSSTVSVFSPDLGNQVASAGARIASGVAAFRSARSALDQLGAISGIEKVPAGLSAVSALVGAFDPQIAQTISAVANLAKTAISIAKLASTRKTATVDPETKLTSDSQDVAALIANQWGVFSEGGALVVEPDNIAAVGYSAEYRTADYPIEKGGFESYDKVALPFEVRVVMSKGGKLAERQAFLAKLEAIRGDRKLYNVVTPEGSYRNVNIGRVQLDRNADRGATMLTVEVGLREIRQSAAIAFTDSRTPSGADARDDGSVQTQPTDATAAGVK